MAKASISLRLEPHELHIVKESLRVMSAMMEAMLEGKESLENYEFNPGMYESAHMMFMDLEGLRVELGMEPPRPPNIRPATRQEPRQEHDPGLNLIENLKHGYKTAKAAKRTAKGIYKRF